MASNDWQQLDRYKFLDFLLTFKGGFKRSELVEKFSIGEATASRTIASYLQEFPANKEFKGPRFGYASTPSFTSEYSHCALEGLNYLARGESVQTMEVATYSPVLPNLYRPLNTDLISPVTRAMVKSHQVMINYVSTTSGGTDRFVIPHAIFKGGGAWYFRAFDLRSQGFRTFRFSRVSEAVELTEPSTEDQRAHKDESWQRLRKVRLIPHPKNPLPDAQQMDLGIKDKEVSELILSEGVVGFVLTDLRVDCSKGYRLSWKEYPLALENRKELESVDSMVFAPGFD